MTNYDSVIEHFGSEAALARALKINPQAIYQWEGKIPTGRAYQIQVITENKFMASDLLGDEVHAANDPNFDSPSHQPIG